MITAENTHQDDAQLDAVSALLTQTMLAPFFNRRDPGAIGAEVRTVPAKPAPAARALVLA
jgi:hypothetical protein